MKYKLKKVWYSNVSGIQMVRIQILTYNLCTHSFFFHVPKMLGSIAEKCSQENSDHSDQFSEDSPQSSVSRSTELPKSSKHFNCEDEGFKYVVGFLAYKFKDKYPHFGEKTCETPIFEKVDCPWIYALSRGGLTAPSTEFVNVIKKFNDIFCAVHGSTLSKEGKLLGSMTHRISKEFPTFPLDVIQKFVKTRTFIRIKRLNYFLKVENEARKARNAEKRKHFTS